MLVTSGVIMDSRILREARSAAEAGFSVRLIGRYVVEQGDPDPAWPFEVERIPIFRNGNRTVLQKIAERIRFGWQLYRRTLAFQPDLIHCNDFDTLPFGWLAARRRNTPLVYDSHEIWSESLSVAKSQVGKRIVQWLEGPLARSADAVISVSHASAEWMQQRYHLQKLFVITNCPFSYHGVHRTKEERFTVLSQGVFQTDRGYEELIDAAPLLKKDNIQVQIRGYGEEEEHFRALAQQIHSANLTFPEKVPSDQVVLAATSAHLGAVLTKPVSVSYQRTVSNKLFELVNAGLPVLLSDVMEHCYLNEQYHFGVILKEVTPKAIADAAISLKRDTETYKVLAQNAQKAAQILNWECEGKKLQKIYQNLLENENDTAAHE